jgi:hypothetical protein
MSLSKAIFLRIFPKNLPLTADLVSFPDQKTLSNKGFFRLTAKIGFRSKKVQNNLERGI